MFPELKLGTAVSPPNVIVLEEPALLKAGAGVGGSVPGLPLEEQKAPLFASAEPSALSL